jgi:uncharacterized protein YgbK (DUF1537 family)
VVDAASDEHLSIIAQTAAKLGTGCVSCGSAGLAQALPVAFGCASGHRSSYPVCGMGWPVLIVVGSRREATVRQIEVALSTLAASLVEIDPLDLNTTTQRAFGSASRYLAEGINAIVTPAFRPYIPHKSDAVAKCLGEVAAGAAISQPISGLILTGGSVAFSVCSALGIETIEIETELAPGIPSGRVLGGKWDGLRLVTKAGGFGEQDILPRAIEYLRGENRYDQA